MKPIYKFTTHEFIVLYKRVFPLQKGLSFSRYMKILDELDFSPYVFEIENIALFDYYFLELFFYPPMSTLLSFPLLTIKPFSELILLNKCIIRYSKQEKEITLEAGTNIGRIFLFGLYLALIIFMLFIAIIALSVIPLIIATLLSVLLVPIYNRDVQKYERIIKIASNPPKKSKGK